MEQQNVNERRGEPGQRPYVQQVPPGYAPQQPPPGYAPPAEALPAGQFSPRRTAPLLAPPAVSPQPPPLPPSALAQQPAVPQPAVPQPAVPQPAVPQPASPQPAPTATAVLDGPRTARGTEMHTDVGGIDLDGLLIQVLERRCSDLHMTVDAPPTVRENGELMAIPGYDPLAPQVLQKLLYAIVTQKQREIFEEKLELDFAYSVPGRARFRVNMYRQRDAIGAAFRLIPYEIKPLAALGVPPAVANFASLERGFVLVTGPTGSGKSTTLASIVDLANRTRRDHIMTVEDPIEFLHQHQQCLVNQREVGEDTHSFGNALKHVLRQDPDIILVGEMRDLETISVALTAAENRSPCLRHPAHPGRRADHRPRHRRVPAAPAAAGTRAAVRAPCRAWSARRCAARTTATAVPLRLRCSSQLRQSAT